MRGNRNKKLCGVLTVSLDETKGDSDRLVRRFIKKAKNEKIIDEVRERRYHKKPSERRRERLEERDRKIQKENKKREELLKPRDRTIKRRRR
jgi:ribosomal protein S21